MTIHALRGGGAERVFCRLATRWAAAGHEVHVITWSAAASDPGPLAAGIHRHGLDVLRANALWWQALGGHSRRVARLRQVLSDLRPQFVLSFCDQMNISTLQATHGLKLPVWIAERSDPAQQRLSYWWELRRWLAYPRCTGCVVQTEAIADHVARWIPRQRIVVIPNAVDPPPPNRPFTAGHRSPAELEAEDDAGRGREIVLFVGRLAAEKGLDVLLDAWRIAHQQLPQWELWIAGDGLLRETHQRASRDLPRVRFLGWLDDPHSLYRDSQIFVLPSRYEGFPNALLEAMSHGMACVASQSSQAVETLSAEGTAICTVPVGDPRPLAAAIRELAQSPLRRGLLGKAAQQVSLAYQWERIAPAWDRLLADAN